MSTARTVLAVFVVLLCLGFAPMAAEFGFVTLQGGTATYARLLGAAVSEPFAFGPESGFAELTPHWMGMAGTLKVVLGTHAFLASLVMLACLLQLHEGFRRRRPALHRRLGRVTAGVGVVAMLLSVVYLSATPMEHIYGGPPFALGLWGIAVMSLWSVSMGVAQARRRNFDAHRAFMGLFFAGLLVAPSLRLYWIVIGLWLGSGAHATQATAHVIALMILGVQTPLLAVMYMAAHRRSRPARAVSERAVTLGTLALFLSVGAVFAGASTFFGQLAGPTVPLVLGGALVLVLALAPNLGSERDRVLGPLVAGGLFSMGAGWASWGLGIASASGLDRSLLEWGMSTLGLAMAVTLWAFGLLTYRAWKRADRGLMRELALHGLAVALIAPLHAVVQAACLAQGIDAADAWLSAAVLSPGISLSFSYYATAFRGHEVSASLPRAWSRESQGVS